MPRTRAAIGRDEKIEEIVELATSMVEAGGWQALSMAAIARRLGLAQAAIYWYFPSKDHLFVEAVQRSLHRAFKTAKPPARAGFVARITWAVAQIDRLQSVNMALHERARDSEMAAKLERDLRARLKMMLVEQLRPHVDPHDLDLAASALLAAAEGILTSGTPPKEREKVLRFLLDRLASN